MITWDGLEDFFDYECPLCKNYVMLKRNKKNKNLLDSKCAKCGLEISILYEDWENGTRKNI